MTTEMLFAGFGGQGILFSGKQMAKSAMYAGKNVSWLPSYGPEMRGGAANCSVIISDEEVGSPLVTNPDILGIKHPLIQHNVHSNIHPYHIALPLFLKYESHLKNKVLDLFLPAYIS